MNTSTRLLKYIVPYSGSIAIVVIITVLIAFCEIAYVGILAESIDAIKVIDIKLLFSVAVEIQSDLNNEAIPESLRQKFKDNSFSLSDNASISVKEIDAEWLITDGDKTYTVKKQEDKLNIYDTNGLPTSVSFFKGLSLRSRIDLRETEEKTDESSPGLWTFHLKDANAALKMVSIVAVTVLAIFVIKGVLSFGHRYLMSRVSQKLVLNLRIELYDRLVYFPLGFFTERRAGDIMSRGTNDMGVLYTSIHAIAVVIQAGATVLVVLVVMFIKSWQFTLLTIFVFPPAIYVINRFGIRIKNASILIQEKVADISSYLEQTVHGIEIIKSFATEGWERARFAKENRERYSVAMRRARLAAYLFPLIEIMSAFGMMAVFWFGLWQVITGRLTIGWFVGFIGLVGMIYKPVKTLGTFNASFQQALAAAERIFAVMDVEPEAHDAPDAVPLAGIKGDVEFRDVSFAYDSHRSVLKHINLKVNAGESIALVGPSGVGKTTLVNLLTRFYDVTDGEITIDGHSISKITLKSLRRQVGLVPQETVIFGGTVRENVAYGRFDATEDEMIQAAKSANAHEFIAKLPNGYDTSIGERGAQLSGGQRQRLAIARAILKDPHVLILDEATSSLDTESEALVQEALANLMKNRTTFVIAHRLSTVVNADRIIVLNDGEVVESGTHSQLLAQNGLYRKLCDAQFRSDPGRVATEGILEVDSSEDCS
ncbi:ABC transporter ATP-binding protein [Candidatus Poribacteria bacterium]